MEQLWRILTTIDREPNVQTLRDLIREGLKHGQIPIKLLPEVKDSYNKFTSDQKSIADLFLVWVFICAMWMRFWLGPGHPWADIRVDVENGDETRCAPRV